MLRCAGCLLQLQLRAQGSSERRHVSSCRRRRIYTAVHGITGHYRALLGCWYEHVSLTLCDDVTVAQGVASSCGGLKAMGTLFLHSASLALPTLLVRCARSGLPARELTHRFLVAAARAAAAAAASAATRTPHKNAVVALESTPLVDVSSTADGAVPLVLFTTSWDNTARAWDVGDDDDGVQRWRAVRLV